MGLVDFIKKHLSKVQDNEKIYWKINPFNDIEFIFPEKATGNIEKFAINNPIFALQYAYLQGLQNEFPLETFKKGFLLPANRLPELGEDFRQLFEMPPIFKGNFQAHIKGKTTQTTFDVSLKLDMPDGSIVSHYSLLGSFLKLTESELYWLTPIEYQTLKTIEKHQALNPSEKSEIENNLLIFHLQLAQKSGMRLDLSHFNQDRIEIIKPEHIGVALNTLPNGDIELIPTVKGLQPIDIRERLGQIDGQNKQIIRVKNQFVLFDEERMKAIEEIFPTDENTGKRRVRCIKRDHIADFLKTPTAYLDAKLIDLDTGFSLRVLGAEKFVHKYFGGENQSRIDWLGSKNEGLISTPSILVEIVQSEDELNELKELIENAQNLGASIIEFKEQQIDISDTEVLEQILNFIQKNIYQLTPSGENDILTSKGVKSVVDIEENDEENNFESFVSSMNFNKVVPINLENLKRTPYPHQQEGINWILSHLNAVETEKKASGALLADDMGLGKTYMSLVAISEYYQHQSRLSNIQKPVLVVAPLSLLENWKDEIAATFKQSPFKDIVMLQGSGLKKYCIGRSEIKQFLNNDTASADEIRYSLKIGRKYAHERLDMPARLVLTTYQTLRDYQFSLCRVDWSIVIFDEAQNLKNPNAIVTRAAKGIKANFKLLATGTPVENSLKDFWCIMDTSTPGLFKSWREFRETYIKPIEEASDMGTASTLKYKVGKLLRKKAGNFMLRRTKTEELDGLPQKIIYSGCRQDTNYLPILEAQMKGIQLQKYNDILSIVKNCSNEDKRSYILNALRDLKMVSIHPNIRDENKNRLLSEVSLSSKIQAVVKILNKIKQRNEKVLIFAESKLVQSYIAALMMITYGLKVDIINGETLAVANRENGDSRKKIIDKFQRKEGFDILVMSPIAAGVGLTITAANNVIHLERHWNPAKEAQATDRVYRIGQKKQVNVYLPMAVHPQVESFDLQLNRLLNNKIDLSEAVIAHPDIETMLSESISMMS